MGRREYEWIPDASAPAEPPSVSHLHSGSISACLVVRNEEGTIGRCLESLTGAVDEVVVVHDGPCADRTLEIARRAGCRVFEAPFYGHCERHTPQAYDHAKGEWLLNLDADEFLSPEMRDGLRALTSDAGVRGYAFLWKHWDGHRYVSDGGPYKLVLFRKDSVRMLGIIHAPEEVDGLVREVPLHLEHRPPTGHRRLASLVRKMRARARLQAREYLTSLDTVPRFNYPGTLRWTKRRLLTNRWSPILVVPAAIHTFGYVLVALWGQLGPREALRFASSEALYRAMVTGSVAWYRYVQSAR